MRDDLRLLDADPRIAVHVDAAGVVWFTRFKDWTFMIPLAAARLAPDMQRAHGVLPAAQRRQASSQGSSFESFTIAIFQN